MNLYLLLFVLILMLLPLAARKTNKGVSSGLRNFIQGAIFFVFAVLQTIFFIQFYQAINLGSEEMAFLLAFPSCLLAIAIEFYLLDVIARRVA